MMFRNIDSNSKAAQRLQLSIHVWLQNLMDFNTTFDEH